MSNNEDPSNGRLTPYGWQRAILASDLPSTTKLVLMALSTHINKGTGLAFPSIRMLMKDTGLSNKAVIQHLGSAKRAGWIETGNHGYFDQRWARKSYRPQIPVNLQGGERRTPPFDAKNALELAPVLACSDSQAAPPLINNKLTRERGQPPLSTPPDSLSVFSNSPQEGETSKVGVTARNQNSLGPQSRPVLGPH
jgi:DNA-binding transcriptional MocR family regulator